MNIYLALQQQQVDIPENSWVGHTSMAGIGILLLVLSVMCIKGRKPKGADKGSKERVPMFLWGPVATALGDRLITQPTQRMFDKVAGVKEGQASVTEGLDWRSLMTWSIGTFSTTALLSSRPGDVLSVAEWFQGLVLSIADWPILSDLGAAGLCFVLLILAMRSRDDDMKDLMYGALCGLIWPLGGGWFAGVTFDIGNWIPQLLQIG